MFTGLVQNVHRAKFLLENHSTTILTGVGVGGTIATAYLTGRASFKAARLISEEQDVLMAAWREGESDVPPAEVSRTQKVKVSWKLYIPPVATGVTTITCIIVANKISSKKIAALAVAGGISERALQEYKDKVVERLGSRQDQKIRDEIAQDRVNNHPINKEIILAGTGEVLCYDLTTGRYFQSTVEDIKRAENKVNYELLHHMSASLSEFFDELGLPSTNYTDSVGWSPGHICKVVLSTVMSPDNRPCIAVDFEQPPHMEYARVY